MRGRGLITANKKVKEFFVDRFGEEVGSIVQQHAVAAAVAALVSTVPGAGATIAVTAQVAAVYTMYLRINAALGVKLGKNKLKTVASAVVSNIAANAASYIASIVIATGLSFIPGIGSATATVIIGGLGYATMVVAALTYTSIINAVGTRSMETLSEEELKRLAAEEMGKRDISGEMKSFSSEYKRARKAGEFTGAESVELEDMDE